MSNSFENIFLFVRICERRNRMARYYQYTRNFRKHFATTLGKKSPLLLLLLLLLIFIVLPLVRRVLTHRTPNRFRRQPPVDALDVETVSARERSHVLAFLELLETHRTERIASQF